MGFWKNVAYDMQRGMSEEKAIEVNSLRYSHLTNEEKRKIEAQAEAEIILNRIP